LGNKQVTNSYAIKPIFRQIEAPELSDKININSNVHIITKEFKSELERKSRSIRSVEKVEERLQEKHADLSKSKRREQKKIKLSN
jgi:hypothetical protein